MLHARKTFRLALWECLPQVFSSGIDNRPVGGGGGDFREEKLTIQRVQTSPGIHPRSCNMGIRSYFLGSEEVSHETTRWPPPSVKLKLIWNTSFILYIPSLRGAHSSTWTALLSPQQLRSITIFLSLRSHTVANNGIWYFHSVVYLNVFYSL